MTYHAKVSLALTLSSMQKFSVHRWIEPANFCFWSRRALDELSNRIVSRMRTSIGCYRDYIFLCINQQIIILPTAHPSVPTLRHFCVFFLKTFDLYVNWINSCLENQSHSLCSIPTLVTFLRPWIRRFTMIISDWWLWASRKKKAKNNRKTQKNISL